ncbi:MAG: glycogen debranching protein GlgX [Candidatus Limnocylindria bacterium]
MTPWLGRPYPFGATWDGHGVNFALYSEHAEGVLLCLFDPDGNERRIRLSERTDLVWHTYVPGIGPGQRYGYRVEGRYAPEEGHRYNPNKLLLDPYARRIDGAVAATARLFGYRRGDPAADLSFDDRDSARELPRCVVVDPAFDWQDDRRLNTPVEQTLIYEVHVRGFTRQHPDVPAELRGSYAGLASEAALAHLARLGVTAVELLPVHAHADRAFLVERGLVDYWGYNTIGFFAPEHRYASGDDPLREFKQMVRRLHAAGIEVILDVVYNHTAEGDQLGPTLAWRGIDNLAYYRLDPADRRRYVDYTGTGNTLNAVHPRALGLLVDSLRYWVIEMHVDGFRFDLAPALARGPRDVDRLGSFFENLRQDSTLDGVKLIAEPWDLGPGGYQLGNFPAGWSEWNGKFRDTVRRFWHGDGGQAAELASRVSGSSDLYARSGRQPHASVNYVTSHDGFTLADLVSYERKHNEANGEHNRDGEDHNASLNFGAEGATHDAAILEARDRQRRNLLATLLLSQGVPMLLGGDEIGRTQLGNNNAYCQDGPISWFDWELGPREEALLDFTAGLVRLFRTHPVLRRRRFFQGRRIGGSSVKDITWYGADGAEMTDRDWAADCVHTLAARLAGDAIEETDEQGAPMVDDTLLMVLNASGATAEFRLPADGAPDASRAAGWRLVFDTTSAAPPRRDGGPAIAGGSVYPVSPRSFVLLSSPRAERPRTGEPG